MLNITFKGKTPEQYGAWLANKPVITHSEIKRHSWEIPMHDGLEYAKDYYRGDAQCEILIHMKNENWRASMREVREWLSGYGRLVFSDSTDSFYEVVNIDLTEETRPTDDYGRLKALMTLYPYEFLNSGETPLSTPTIVNNYGDSKPLIKITGTAGATGTINIRGHISFKMPSEGNLYIDVRNMEAYSIAQNNDKKPADNKVNGDYERLILKKGSNTISVSSGFTVEVTPNWGYYI